MAKNKSVIQLPVIKGGVNMPKLPEVMFPTSGSQQGKNKRMSSEDLYKIADSIGLKNRADKILAEKGEEEKFLGGGWIMDTFDILNFLQYGVTGIIKGKGWSEGVKNRESFSDKDALGEFGLPGAIAGMVMDIAVDPLTWISPWTIIKKIPKAGKVGKITTKALKNNRATAWFGKALVFRFGVDPMWAKAADRMEHAVGGMQAKLARIAEPLSKITPDAVEKLFIKNPDLSIGLRKIDDLPKILSGEQLESAQKLWGLIDDYGKQAHNLGLIDEPIENYVTNMYEYYLKKDQSFWKKMFGTKKTITGKTFKKRKLVADKTLDDIDKLKRAGKIDEAQKALKKYKNIQKTRRELGEITDSMYPAISGLAQTIKDVETAKLFKIAADKGWAKPAKEVTEGWKVLPNTNKLGALKSKAVPEWLAEEITEMVGYFQPGIFQKVMAGFKYNKVILNPATHIRNVFSNLILNNFEGLKPYRIDVYGKAAKEMATKGKIWREFKDLGGAIDTLAAREIDDLLLGPGIKATGKARGAVKKMAGKLSKIYQGEEEYAKLAQYIFQKNRLLKMGADDMVKEFGRVLKGDDLLYEAMKIGERATFNYAQVTPFVRKVRESMFGFPFITFSYFATKQTAKTAIKHPARLSWIGKTKNAIENMANIQELKSERGVEPSWVRNGLYVKMPMKDQYGRSAYFDLTYIIPYGDVISGALFERQLDFETGLPESHFEGVIKKMPIINFVSEVARNEDFYGNQIWKPSDTVEKQTFDLFRHTAKMYLPPLVGDMIPGGYRKKGKKKGKRRPSIVTRPKEAGDGTQYRTGMEEFMRQIALKIQPIDKDIQEKYMEYEKKSALETLIKEYNPNIIRTYRKLYQRSE